MIIAHAVRLKYMVLANCAVLEDHSFLPALDYGALSFLVGVATNYKSRTKAIVSSVEDEDDNPRHTSVT